MPIRWLHEYLDIITFQKSFWWVHKYKDEPSQIYGPDHRKIRHQDFSEVALVLKKKGLIPLTKRFDDAFQFIQGIPFGLFVLQTQSLKAGIFHEVWDEILWKGLSKQERAYEATQIALGILYEKYLSNKKLQKIEDDITKKGEGLRRKYPHYQDWRLVYSIKEVFDQPLELIENRLEILKPTIHKEIFNRSGKFMREVKRMEGEWGKIAGEVENMKTIPIPCAAIGSIKDFITQEMIKYPSLKAIEMFNDFLKKQHPNFSKFLDFFERVLNLLERHFDMLFTEEGKNIAWNAFFLILTKLASENPNEIDKALNKIRDYVKGKKPIELI